MSYYTLKPSQKTNFQGLNSAFKLTNSLDRCNFEGQKIGIDKRTFKSILDGKVTKGETIDRVWEILEYECGKVDYKLPYANFILHDSIGEFIEDFFDNSIIIPSIKENLLLFDFTQFAGKHLLNTIDLIYEVTDFNTFINNKKRLKELNKLTALFPTSILVDDDAMLNIWIESYPYKEKTQNKEINSIFPQTPDLRIGMLVSVLSGKYLHDNLSTIIYNDNNTLFSYDTSNPYTATIYENEFDLKKNSTVLVLDCISQNNNDGMNGQCAIIITLNEKWFMDEIFISIEDFPYSYLLPEHLDFLKMYIGLSWFTLRSTLSFIPSYPLKPSQKDLYNLKEFFVYNKHTKEQHQMYKIILP